MKNYDYPWGSHLDWKWKGKRRAICVGNGAAIECFPGCGSVRADAWKRDRLQRMLKLEPKASAQITVAELKGWLRDGPRRLIQDCQRTLDRQPIDRTLVRCATRWLRAHVAGTADLEVDLVETETGHALHLRQPESRWFALVMLMRPERRFSKPGKDPMPGCGRTKR